MAWHAALFTRAAKLPSLQPLLNGLRAKTSKAASTVAKKPQTWQEQKAIMSAMRGLMSKAAAKPTPTPPGKPATRKGR